MLLLHPLHPTPHIPRVCSTPTLQHFQCFFGKCVVGIEVEGLSTTVVRLASPLRPSSAVIAAVEVMVASSVHRSGRRFPTTAASSSPEDRSAAGSRPSATSSSPEDRSAVGVLGPGTGLPTTATSSSPEDRSAAGNEPSATDSSPEYRSAGGVQAGLPLDAPRGAGSLAAGDRTLLVVTAVDSSGRLDFGHGKKVDKTLTVHVELGKSSLNFRSRS